MFVQYSKSEGVDAQFGERFGIASDLGLNFKIRQSFSQIVNFRLSRMAICESRILKLQQRSFRKQTRYKSVYQEDLYLDEAYENEFLRQVLGQAHHVPAHSSYSMSL